MGISPPARNVAFSPDSATRSGSATLLTRPFSSSAESSRLMLTPCVLTTLASNTPKDDSVEPDPGKTPLLFAAVVWAAPSPVAKLTLWLVPNQLGSTALPAVAHACTEPT